MATARRCGGAVSSSSVVRQRRASPGGRARLRPPRVAGGEAGAGAGAEDSRSVEVQRELARRLRDADAALAAIQRTEGVGVGVDPADTVGEAWERGRWLLSLLVLQSTSSFVLEANEALVREHLVVTLFLTMLVGAGGNAGNQSAIKVIRQLATGEITATWSDAQRTLNQQMRVALLLGVGLSAGGFARVFVTNGDPLNSLAIACSLFGIVTTSCWVGTALPFALAALKVDPANAGTTVQVVMDVLGVVITTGTCGLLLDGVDWSSLGS